ncbi:bifunctional hydroxymethylpyrimidine kinase/phosphomethylpyrimidine kinase [Cellulomonas wangsupingiae]|uniref:pyridoxal kinase n=1 Tax=Cellulomonas wangsupingiae TaxID=2968085 RepID=A0ABY5K5Q8_9CELL|nr:bifunctional hydroxymethylpyrimidine kinase/phosphomethylpyrimidine kinase [Cellulomonas wangsupingiae]MCC2336646.1 bifunctional hydroxymethylpyrimidine kinase/phosphomethylpyrimidine kinase [Cellulomonas wangsupingiae]MCM0640513.1 bifunctional hydroxymethylpyrimidine kinase/phosphomethylpyrimidine kinase [Cellulomonas wangsupingiae]UUI64477.1 bifunctional hydroxymethylpyrimidine kinase/phosphomethylpyrimidine kinase [Cellulomonas wangsupingiae]
MVDLAYVIAGSEATGGAGIQADLRTFQELGAFGLGTVTCIVSFDPANDWGHRFFPVPPEVIAQQVEAATAAYDLDVVKIGMLGTPATIEVVAEGLRRQPWRHVVLDPVLICKGQEPGAALDTDNALREHVVPLATVVTPNLFETRALSGMETIETVEQLTEAARRIQQLGPRYVVAKGGVELPGEDAVDVLVDGDEVTVLRTPKVGRERVAGAGCTLAAAITAELAKGAEVGAAVARAKDFVTAGIEGRVSGRAPFEVVRQGA